ncbi:carbon-phosphorus lyase complex subunit [Bradyrhizobium sp. STM 3843]|uniref:phosphonate C-P lyase system protein PhnH n=1 Tax=Bradyrhizobium sp. STM 3843 TaxID=551947 RepID=UPI00024034A5|nr:phosphonate C-P lyase system protein PhnH [Bradyrhizobium sp. STM 3843]CCE11361.1 carbon-phosphorus lyase complex subunit [Bradyrhizobium sp. STM 3843]
MEAMISDLLAGFPDAVLSAQSTFRAVMEAMARPGTIQRVAATVGVPSGLTRAAAALALTLFDHDTPVWLDPALATGPDVATWLKFHTGAPVVAETVRASFALIRDGGLLPDLESFALGSGEYPDRSTTLILQVASLGEGRAYELRGPGIDGAATLCTAIAPDDLFDRLAINEELFPRGIDVVLVHDDSMVAIPRTTRLVVAGG